MCRFIESIKLKDGKIHHLDWHQKRVNETFAAHFVDSKPLHLKDLLNSNKLPKQGVYKVRIVYDSTYKTISIQPYTSKIIKSIAFVEVQFDYNFKYENREEIKMYKDVANSDEVIFMKDNFIYDSSYSNLAFLKDKQWITPKTYLLNGTTRRRLLSNNQLIESKIKKSDLRKFSHVSFINAMNDLGENVMHLNHCFI